MTLENTSLADGRRNAMVLQEIQPGLLGSPIIMRLAMATIARWSDLNRHGSILLSKFGCSAGNEPFAIGPMVPARLSQCELLQMTRPSCLRYWAQLGPNARVTGPCGA
jgi:hypothetical protein